MLRCNSTLKPRDFGPKEEYQVQRMEMKGMWHHLDNIAVSLNKKARQTPAQDSTSGIYAAIDDKLFKTLDLFDDLQTKMYGLS